jgi:hypothetical protein
MKLINEIETTRKMNNTNGNDKFRGGAQRRRLANVVTLESAGSKVGCGSAVSGQRKGWVYKRL